MQRSNRVKQSMDLFRYGDYSKEEVARQVHIRKKLSDELAQCVKSLQEDKIEDVSIPISSSTLANNVCYVLEAIFIHGLKDSFMNKITSLWNNDPDKMPEPTFWQFVQQFSHKNVISQLYALTQITTELGLCRAWLRLALNDGILEGYLSSMLKDRNVLRYFYSRLSYLRDVEACEILKQHIVGLGSLCFTLSYNATVLNEWSCVPLQLSGVWDQARVPMPTIAPGAVLLRNPQQQEGETAAADGKVPGRVETAQVPYMYSSGGHSNMARGNRSSNLRIGSPHSTANSSETDDTSMLSSIPDPVREFGLTPVLFNEFYSLGGGQPPPQLPQQEHKGIAGSGDGEPSGDAMVSSSHTVTAEEQEGVVTEQQPPPPTQGSSDQLADEPGAQPTSTVYSKHMLGQESNMGWSSVFDPPIPASRVGGTGGGGTSDVEPVGALTSSTHDGAGGGEGGELQESLEEVIDRLNVSTPPPVQSGGGRVAPAAAPVPHQQLQPSSHSDQGTVEKQQREDDAPDSGAGSPGQAASAPALSDFEVLPVSSCSVTSPRAEPRIQSLIALLGHICPERGLDARNYECRACGRPVGMIYGKARVCTYDGYSYCYECHENEEHVIPAKILHSWDFKKYKVSKYTYVFLQQIYNEPLLDVKRYNPTLYGAVNELNDVKLLRQQLSYLKAYLFTCKQSVADELRRRIWPREHLYDNIHRYSLADLDEVVSGTLGEQVKKVIQFAIKHVHGCAMCSQKGFICEVCQSGRVIFPFEVHTTYRCEKCQAVYHQACQDELKPCPKCERRRKHQLQLHAAAADFSCLPAAGPATTAPALTFQAKS